MEQLLYYYTAALPTYFRFDKNRWALFRNQQICMDIEHVS